MKKFTYHIKGTYPEHVLTNVNVLDISKSTKSEFQAVHFYETPYRGRIWVDGIEINKKAAIQARHAFSEVGRCFTWGEEITMGPRVTALAICLHIFGDEQIAVNMYIPFMREILVDIKNASFEIDIDLESFVNDHASRMSHDFYTHYFDLGPFHKYEFNFKKDNTTGNWSADILNQLCTELVLREKNNYEKPSLGYTFFGNTEPPKPSFDWEKAYEIRQKELCRLFFTPFTSSVSSTTLPGVIANAGICLKLYDKLHTKKIQGEFQKERDRNRRFDELIREYGANEERKYELSLVGEKVGASLDQLLNAIIVVGVDLEKVEKYLRDKLAAEKDRIRFDYSVPGENLLSPINLNLLYAFHKLWSQHHIREKDYEILLYDDVPEIFLDHGYPGITGRNKEWSLNLVYQTSKMEYFIRDFNFTSVNDIYNIPVEQVYDLYLQGKARVVCSVGRDASTLFFSLKDNQQYVTEGWTTGGTFRLEQPLNEACEFVKYTLAFFKKKLDEEREELRNLNSKTI